MRNLDPRPSLMINRVLWPLLKRRTTQNNIPTVNVISTRVTAVKLWSMIVLLYVCDPWALFRIISAIVMCIRWVSFSYIYTTFWIDTLQNKGDADSISNSYMWYRTISNRRQPDDIFLLFVTSRIQQGYYTTPERDRTIPVSSGGCISGTMSHITP